MANIDDMCRIYLAAANRFIEARENYRVAFAKAMADSQAKNDTLRKSEADQKTSTLRLTRDKCEVEAAVEWQRLLAARGPMTDSIQPLQKFGDT